MRDLEKNKSIEGEGVPMYDAQWESLRNGNTEVFETIFRKYYPVLYSYGMKFSGSEEEVKDSIQSLFLQIWERRNSLGPTTSGKNYLLASLRRILHRNSEASSQSSFQLIADHQHVEFSVESKIIASQTNAESLEVLRAAFEKLPARQKEAVYLRFYDNQDFNEIATIMGITVRATYKLIYKGLDSLQEQFGEKKVNLEQLLTIFFLVASQIGSSL